MNDKEWNEITAMLQEEPSISRAPTISRSEYMRRKEARKSRLKRRRIRRIRNGVVTIFVLTLIILCIVLFFRSCSTDKRIVGTWDYDTVTVYRFDKNGEGALLLPNESHVFSYSIEEDQLVIDFENENVADHTYTFSINGSELTLTAEESAGTEYVLTRK